MELPNYSTKPNIVRILFPKIVFLLVLAALLYIGVRINFIIFNKEFPMVINIAVIGVIVILALIEIILTNKKVKDSRIYFFNDRIEIKGKEEMRIMLATISSTDVKKNLIDSLFKTGTVVLSTGQTIKNINYPERIQAYIAQIKGKSPAVKRRFK